MSSHTHTHTKQDYLTINYKGSSHNVVLLAICDANYIFQFIEIGAYEPRNDEKRIFKESVFVL